MARSTAGPAPRRPAVPTLAPSAPAPRREARPSPQPTGRRGPAFLVRAMMDDESPYDVSIHWRVCWASAPPVLRESWLSQLGRTAAISALLATSAPAAWACLPTPPSPFGWLDQDLPPAMGWVGRPGQAIQPHTRPASLLFRRHPSLRCPSSFSHPSPFLAGPRHPRRRRLGCHLPRVQPQEVRGPGRRRRRRPPGGRTFGPHDAGPGRAAGGWGRRRRPVRALGGPGPDLPLASPPGGRDGKNEGRHGGSAGGLRGLHPGVAGLGRAPHFQCVLFFF